MKVAEKDGEKKTKNKKQQESYAEWIGWGEIKKRKLKKGRE